MKMMQKNRSPSAPRCRRPVKVDQRPAVVFLDCLKKLPIYVGLISLVG